MKTFVKLLGIIAIGAVLAIGLIGCSSTPKELDPVTAGLRDTMEKYTWEVIPLKRIPLRTGFSACDKIETSAFANTSTAEKMEQGKNYALTAQELPDTYYFFSKDKLFGKDIYSLTKSTTIDDATFAEQIAFTNASWVVKDLDTEPSLNGFEKLVTTSAIITNNPEFDFINIIGFGGSDAEWKEITAAEYPNITYYYHPDKLASTKGAVSAIIIYKRGQ